MSQNRDLLSVYNTNSQSNKTIINYVYPHKLPTERSQNPIGKQWGENRNLVRERYYGPDGKTQKDVDYQHGD